MTAHVLVLLKCSDCVGCNAALHNWTALVFELLPHSAKIEQVDTSKYIQRPSKSFISTRGQCETGACLGPNRSSDNSSLTVAICCSPPFLSRSPCALMNQINWVCRPGSGWQGDRGQRRSGLAASSLPPYSVLPAH